jgi:hypothetical protein
MSEINIRLLSKPSESEFLRHGAQKRNVLSVREHRDRRTTKLILMSFERSLILRSYLDGAYVDFAEVFLNNG